MHRSVCAFADIDESGNQSGGQMRQAANQPVGQAISQGISQSENQSVYLPFNQTFGLAGCQ